MFREMRHGAAMPPMRGYGRGYYEPYSGAGGAGSALPKVIGVVVAIGLIIAGVLLVELGSHPAGAKDSTP